MKVVPVFVLVMFCCLHIYPQTGDNGLGMVGGLNPASPNFFLTNLKDVKGANVFNPDVYDGIEGSPYLSPDWIYARIKLNDNRTYDSVLIKFNLYENRIHFKDEAGNKKMLAVQMKEVEIKDQSSEWNNFIFVSGYGGDITVFYQATTNGKKAALFKKMNVIITETKVFNGAVQKKFVLQERLYVYSDNVLYQESKNCSSLMNAFGKYSKLATFISSNDLKCNKEKDLLKLVNYYNSY